MLCQSNDTKTEELVRLASFSKWPAELAATAVSFVRLAAAGFRYTGQSDSIMCSFCETEVRGWLGTHRRPPLEHECSLNRAYQRTDSGQHEGPAPTTADVRETVAGEVKFYLTPHGYNNQTWKYNIAGDIKLDG